MISQKQWEDEVREVFEKMKLHKEPYEINIHGKELIVFPNVFSPENFTDSKWFAEVIPKIVGKKRLLEIGTGIGVVALFAALNGAEVVATDINSDAVKNAKANFKRYNLNVPVFLGDMYKPLKPNEKFDFIFWNHPFNRGENPNEEMIFKSGFDYKYNSLKKYIENAHKHLSENGRLLLGTSNFAKLDGIEEIAKKSGYKMELLEEIKAPVTKESEIKINYRIYEFVK